MITVKDDSVKLKVLSLALSHIFYTLSNLNQRQLLEYPLNWVITSINDGNHVKGSRHYTNEALDLRSKNFKSHESKLHFKALLELELGPKFTVLLENEGEANEHFHIQVKKGLMFP